MIIRLKDDYSISIEPNKYVLMRDRLIEEGKNAGEIKTDSWDYSTLNGCVKGLVRKKASGEAVIQAKELADMFDGFIENIVLQIEEAKR